MRRADMMKYIVSEYLLPKLAPNHITAKEKRGASENENECGLNEKRIRVIYG